MGENPEITSKDYLSLSQNAKHDENSINKIIRENSLKGKYFTPKVPYGYNYYDHNHNTLDSYGYMHGMHVAGTIGANSSKGAEIDGVAPNVQLLALKVFSDDLQYPTTFTDVWLKAIDDAIVLKADVINMSLGSAAGLASSGERPEDIALKRAKDAGIVVAIAGGNDGNIMTGYHHKDKSRVENPDTSLIASPSLLHDSISVASIENAVKYVNKLYWQDDSANINLSMGLIDSLTAKGIDLGSGEEKDYIGKNVRDKIVLIEKPKPKAKSEEVNITSQTILTVKDSITTSNILNIKEKDQLDEEKPQELSLGEKILLAQNKGAVGIIIYNDPDSGENLGRNISYSSPIKDFPIALIGFRNGQKLIANIKENPDLEINMSNKLEEEPNLYQGEVSFFSSWGPTPDLRIKPEVSAPGGYIYSTAEEDKYQNMSGTSMASPHVAGASAILKQYLKHQGIDNSDSVELIKLLLMNTAKPVLNAQKKVDFVRKQGAGIIRLDKALKTKVTVKAIGTNDNIEDGKLEIKEILNNNFNFTLKLENKGDEDKRYNISAIGIYEIVQGEQLSEVAENIENFGDLNQDIKLEKNSVKEFNYTIDFSKYSQIRENSFIEGYIKLKDMDIENEVDLTVPFLAYYGDWGAPKAIDAFEIKEKNEESKRKPQIVINKGENAYASLFFSKNGLRLPIIKDKIYFYPDKFGVNPNNYYPWVSVRLAALRNISNIEYSILDEETEKVVKVIGESQDVRKVNRLYTSPAYRTMPDSLWNGLIDGREVTEDDKLIYQIKATLNNHTEKEKTVQIYQYPIRVDKKSPVLDGEINIENASSTNKKIEFFVQDSGSGLNSIYIQSVYFKRRFPSTAPGEPPNLKDDEPADPKEVGENPDLRKWKPQYGKFQRIVFVDGKNLKDSDLPNADYKLLKVENGELFIPETMAKETAIFCDINGHENEKIHLKTYYDVDQPYLEIIVGDNLTNKLRKTISTGYVSNSYKLTFLDYKNNIKANDGKISVNGKDVIYDTSVSGKAQISIYFPNKKTKIVHLKIGSGKTYEILIDKGVVNPLVKEKYKIEFDKVSCRFVIEDNKRNLDITTTVEKVLSESDKARLSFEKVDLSKFHPITRNKKKINKENPISQEKKGQIEMLVGLVNPKDEINRIALELESGKLIELKKANSYNEYIARFTKNIYYLDDIYGDLEMKFDLKENAKLIIDFKSPSSHEIGEGTNSNSSSQNKDNKSKYPVIFLRKPGLLDIQTERTIGENGFAVEGFVGHVSNQGLEKIIISLVDEKGDIIENTYDFPMDKINKRYVNHIIDGRRLYSGIGYEFKFEMKPSVFNTNIRIEAITKDGQRASIVRRLFFDEEHPTLKYEIMRRSLSDEKMQLKIDAQDNSYKISIYKDDSYLAQIDLSKTSLEKNNIRYSKQFEIPLKLGQNRIVLRVSDPARHDTYKVLYVYRSEK